MDVERKFWTDLGNDRGEKSTCLVEIFVIGRVAVQAGQANALEQLVAARPDRHIVDQAHIDPQAWLTWVLAQIADHKITRLNEFMPWRYAAVAA